MRIVVHGIPAPQGSKRHVGGGRMIESSAKVKPWREAVKWAALERCDLPFLVGPVRVLVEFYLPRPMGHYGTGRNEGEVKASAPTRPHRKPDLDKLIRSTLDGLGESGVWGDDSQVVYIEACKWYADERPPGALIEVRETS
jgi:Holliday junction resolvase RusA-like endonuclease